MKTRFLLSIALLTACFFSCQKESITANNEEGTIVAMKKGIPPSGGPNTTCGNWTVSSFTKNGINSGDFNGYTFVFCTDHTLTAINGQTTIRGSWFTNGIETATGATYFMTLYFDTNPPDPLVILNAQWTMPEMTDNVIQLQRSGEEGNLEIIFTKQG